MFIVSKDFPCMLKLSPSRRRGRCATRSSMERLRLHGHQQRAVGDRTALDDADGVRSEHRDDHMEDPSG